MYSDSVLRATVCIALLCGCVATPRPFPARDPLWRDDDAQPFAPRPEKYRSHLLWDGANQMVFRPVARFFAVDPAGEAINVNAVDEVPDSSFFENRIGRHAMTPEVFARGSCGEGPPLDPAGPWTVVGAKPDGAHAGFIVEDALGRKFMMKFDGFEQPERATSADVIGAILYHAAGYHVPCNQIVFFERSALQLGSDTDVDVKDVDKVLRKAGRAPDGRYRGMASLFLAGKPIGPFRYEGTRPDDPNDVVDHQDRRELRGGYVLAAWLNHFDAREQNTFDAWIETADGRGYVKHHYLDFGDCFGSQWASDGITRRLGSSGYFKFDHIVRDFVTLGLVERPWEKARIGPAGEIFGYYGTFDDFDPDAWFTGYPNPAFSRRSERDAAWMARILARIDRQQLRAAIAKAAFSKQLYADELLRILEGRRARISQRFLSRVSPLTAPVIEQNERGRHDLCLQDLAIHAGVVKPSARGYTATVHIEQRLAALSIRLRGRDRVCVQLPEAFRANAQQAAYVIVEVRGSVRGREQQEGPVRVHLYDFGTDQLVVGLERPDNVVAADESASF